VTFPRLDEKVSVAFSSDDHAISHAMRNEVHFQLSYLHRLVQFLRSRNYSTLWKKESNKGHPQASSLMSCSSLHIAWGEPDFGEAMRHLDTSSVEPSRETRTGPPATHPRSRAMLAAQASMAGQSRKSPS
jgi:hypothetical protein